MGNIRFIRLKAKYLTSGQKGLTELPESQLNSPRDISLRMNNGINMVNWNLIFICRMPHDRELQISRSKKNPASCNFSSLFCALTQVLSHHHLYLYFWLARWRHTIYRMTQHLSVLLPSFKYALGYTNWAMDWRLRTLPSWTGRSSNQEASLHGNERLKN